MTRLARFLPAVLFLGSGCGRPPSPPLSFVLLNRTGTDLHDFSLDTGSGAIEFQIFTDGYTFRKEVRIQRSSPLKLACRVGSGSAVSRALDWTVEPGHNGGELRITFQPEGKETFAFHPLREVVPKATAKENIEDARKWFDAVSLEMTDEEALEITGHKKMTARKYHSSKDFGKSFTPQCVELKIFFLEGRVARVHITFPYDGPRKGEIVAEKGMPEEEYNRR